MTFREMLRGAEINELYKLIEAAANLKLWSAASLCYAELKFRRTWSE